MRLSISIFRHALPGTLLTMALTFGAASALADVPLAACTDPAADGTCYTDAGCDRLCRDKLGPYAASRCEVPCCYCYEGLTPN